MATGVPTGLNAVKCTSMASGAIWIGRPTFSTSQVTASARPARGPTMSISTMSPPRDVRA
jgi:hypothetical protein